MPRKKTAKKAAKKSPARKRPAKRQTTKARGGEVSRETRPYRQRKTSELIEAVRKSHGLIYRAAKQLKCAPSVFYERMKVDPELRQAIEDERGETLDLAEWGLRENLEQKDMGAIRFTLLSLGRARGYVEYRRHEHSGPDGDGIPVDIFSLVQRAKANRAEREKREAARREAKAAS